VILAPTRAPAVAGFMYRIIICAAVGALFIRSQAIAQEKVSFPSTDGDLKDGTPTTITGYLYKPAGAGPFAAVVGMHGCGGINPISRPVFEQWGEIFSREQYIFLMLDSFQPRGRDSLCDDHGVGLLAVTPRDEHSDDGDRSFQRMTTTWSNR
jgi:dienelactone hydrolase